MKRRIIISVASYFIIFCNNKVLGQTVNDSLINKGMNFEIKNDTLFSSTGLKFFIGQKLVIGNPSGNDGYFRSIVHKSAAIVPSIWGQDARYENAIENHVNKKKSREKVKSYLITGNLLTVKGIRYSKTGKPYFYLISFSIDTEDFYCDIKLALILNELLLQP